MRPYKWIFFDFDGTIADSLEMGVAISNRLAVKYKYRKIDKDLMRKLRSTSSKEVFTTLGIKTLSLPLIVRSFHKEMAHSVTDLKVFDGLIDVLHNLKASGIKLGIVSSNSESNIKAFLKNYEISDCFEFCQGGIQLFGKSKSLEKALKKVKANRKEVLYIGDESRDIEAAQTTNMPVAGVTWGFSDRESLARFEPDFLFDTVEELRVFAHGKN